MPGPLRHNERDAPPVRRRPAGVRCPVRQDHVTFALASLAIGLGAMVADPGAAALGSRFELFRWRGEAKC